MCNIADKPAQAQGEHQTQLQLIAATPPAALSSERSVY
jgi:hypothetical protein